MLRHVVDVRAQVGHPRLDELEVFFPVLFRQRGARHHLWRAARVELERADRADDDGARRPQPRVVALDVEELLAAHVRSEARLGEHVALWPHELERQLVGDDARVAVRDVGERSGVDERGRALERLHRRRLQSLHHQHGERAGDAEVVGGERRACLRVARDHPAEARAEVGEVGGEREDGHDLGGHRDREAAPPRELLTRLLRHLGRREPHFDLAEVAVVRIGDALPRHRRRVDVEAAERLDLGARHRAGVVGGDAELGEPRAHRRLEGAFAVAVLRAELVEEEGGRGRPLVEDAGVDRRGEEVVRGGDRVDVARHVQVELLHRRALRVAAARRAALDPKRRPHRRLADARDDRLAEVRAERLRQPDRRRRLPLAERRRVDPAHDDVVAVGPLAQPVVHREAELPLVQPVLEELVAPQPRELLLEELLDRRERHRLRHLDVGRHRHLEVQHVAALRREQPPRNFGEAAAEEHCDADCCERNRGSAARLQRGEREHAQPEEHLRGLGTEEHLRGLGSRACVARVLEID